MSHQHILLAMSTYLFQINAANIKVNPLGRICSPSDVAQAVAFLASDWATFINGVLLPVDGGHSLTLAMPQLQ